MDLRKSFNGLQGVIRDRRKADPCSGALKRPEQGCFTQPKGVGKREKLALAPETPALLPDGVDLKQGSFKPWHQR